MLTMIVPQDWVQQRAIPPVPNGYYENPTWLSANSMVNTPAPNSVPAMQDGLPWGKILTGGALAILGLVVLTSDSEPKKRYCGACDRAGHDSRNCPNRGRRVNFSRSIPKSRRCQCCDQSRYETQRHHPRGRADASDRLDLCRDCHIECGHDGHYQNAPRKPLVCRVMNRRSAWRG